MAERAAASRSRRARTACVDACRGESSLDCCQFIDPLYSNDAQDADEWDEAEVKRAITTTAYGLGPELSKKIVFYLAHVL